MARALVDRLNVDVRPDDVRATLRVRKTEPATAAAPRRLEGIQSEAVVYYYDTYVRGLPPYVRTSRHSPYERATWTAYEDGEAPPPDDLDASAVVAAVRSATTTEQFTCDQIRAIERLDQRGSRADAWQPETELSYTDPEKGLRSLQKTLGLDDPIRCLEGIDIAHLQGGETVGSKVCFLDGRPFKSEYRRYRIRRADNDDYASIKEVVSRRYREAGEGHELFPDVILIDGGLGQLQDGGHEVDVADLSIAALRKLALQGVPLRQLDDHLPTGAE